MADIGMLEQVSLDKAAVDAGFDIKCTSASSWLSYASTSCPLRIWLTVVDAKPIAALSMANVLAEIAQPQACSNPPEGAGGAFTTTSFGKLQVLLARAYALANTLPQQLFHTWTEQVEALPVTEREAIAKQRIGQDLFRQGLMALWQGRCALTGLAIPELLRASHAKPWQFATDAERLDVYNGLLLAAHVDAAFDHGFISFDAAGSLLVSIQLTGQDVRLLGLNQAWPKVALRPQHANYMAYHRDQVFQR